MTDKYLLPQPTEPGSRHAYHLYTPLLMLEELRVGRKKIIAALEAENIGVGIHYISVHQHPYYRQQFGFVDSDFPNATFVGERTLSLSLAGNVGAGCVRRGQCDHANFPLPRGLCLKQRRSTRSTDIAVLNVLPKTINS